MFMIIKRKHITFAIGALLCITLAIVISLPSRQKNNKTNIVAVNSSSDDSISPDSGQAISVSASPSDYISDAKNDRDIVRSKVCEFLKETIENESISSSARQNAEQELIDIASQMDAESKCETLLESKGYGECVVLISKNNVTVTVPKKDITDKDVAKINDIIFEQTGNNNIKIVEVN